MIKLLLRAIVNLVTKQGVLRYSAEKLSKINDMDREQSGSKPNWKYMADFFNVPGYGSIE